MIDYKAQYIGVCNTCLSGKSVGNFAMKATEYQYKGGLSELYRSIATRDNRSKCEKLCYCIK